MAAGLVTHNITTAAGVTFTVNSWVPDTAAPDVGAIPVHIMLNSSGAPLAMGSGAVSAATLRAILASDDPAVTQLALIAASASVMDDWDESDRAKVNIIAGQVGVAAGAGASDALTQRIVLASNSPGVSTPGQTTKSASVPVTLASDQEPGFFVTCSTDITRPADTTAYAANDTLANSTSAPTTGGFTLTGAARISGGSGIITDLLVISSNDPSATLQCELWIFDQAVTAVNDNASFGPSDSDIKKLVAMVPFLLQSTVVAGGGSFNSFAHMQGLNIGFTCVGSADLRYLVKVKNAYTPASAEVITVRAKIIQTN